VGQSEHLRLASEPRAKRGDALLQGVSLACDVGKIVGARLLEQSLRAFGNPSELRLHLLERGGVFALLGLKERGELRGCLAEPGESLHVLAESLHPLLNLRGPDSQWLQRGLLTLLHLLHRHGERFESLAETLGHKNGIAQLPGSLGNILLRIQTDLADGSRERLELYELLLESFGGADDLRCLFVGLGHG
jgi:hypothetical protein